MYYSALGFFGNKKTPVCTGENEDYRMYGNRSDIFDNRK